ncbi:AAA domain-containing protein [Flavobacteriaceae bacterium]|nr:AAA domain-containing protein [Flavobacteriaceae bacterium]
MDNLQNWLSYYKNSLLDSENLAIDLKRIKNLFEQNFCDLSTGTIDTKNAATMLDAEERRINRIKGISKKDSPNWLTVTETEILIAPFQLVPTAQDTETYQQQNIYPFWITAKVNRSGHLSPPKELFPIIVRNYVDPIAETGNDFIFSTMEIIAIARELDKPTPFDEEDIIEWSDYWQYLEGVFTKVTFSTIKGYNTEDYTTNPKVIYFAKSAKIATAKSILFLYENILNETEELPLIDKLVNPHDRHRQEAVTDADFLNYNHLHLGQMSNQFPLSISQRKTLLSYLTSEENAITAVNGPPGTGKTTLLQTLVATEVVRAAIVGEDAPLILACSTNNQAVTNIIDSFINSTSTLGDLSERWIPNFNGYATYLPSNSKKVSTLKNINYLKGNLFGHEGTLCDLENEEYVYNAEEYYFDCFYEYFDFTPLSLQDACEHLQNEITVVEDQLIVGGNIAKDYLKSIVQVNTFLNNEEDYIVTNKVSISKLQQWRAIVTTLKTKHQEADFLEQVKACFAINGENNTNKEILFKVDKEQLTDAKTAHNFVKYCINSINLALKSDLKLKDWKRHNNINGFPFESEAQMWEFEYEKLNSNDTSHRFFFDEIDIELRHKAFLLAIHYWEARWILETQDVLENNTEKGTGEIAITSKWKRRAMLTPCFVATFYMAPPHFIYSQFQGENEEGKPIFEYYPLYNILDLLIIDEAGQVTPEVSIPVFSLAKKAMIVGDLKQIEPIWSIPTKIDIGNLTNEEIITTQEENNYLASLGFLASSGSIMKMSQHACEFQTTLGNTTENGLVLLEHRRCNDEIIGFCNELAYGGVLKPMKGKAKVGQLFPSMIAYHVDGTSERNYNSRHNLKEVDAIVLWINKYKEAIQKSYGVEDIEGILGIITPFASQKGELSKALTESGFNVNKIKLGTVHALQGAERHIVLFSSVYCQADEGTMFFDKDNKPNMLNVAVSRARDSFILFGDTRVFDETKKTPSGMLKKHLNLFEI